MHNEESITCNICGLKVARITRYGFFNRPKRLVEYGYVTITNSESNRCWCSDFSATDTDIHLCHDCYQRLKLRVELDKRKENKDA